MLTTQVFEQARNFGNCLAKIDRQSNNKYNSEAKLVSNFEFLLNLNLDQTKTGILKEFDSQNGVADVVVYNLRKDWQSSLTIGEVPARWIYALYALPYRKIFSSSYFMNRTGSSKTRANSALSQYTKLGFCEKTDRKDYWIKVKQPKRIINNIYTIEAKLHDWNRALYQAYRYLEYSTQSWVLLDEYYVRPAISNIEKFEFLNIGLASIGLNGRIISHNSPKEVEPKSELRLWQANSELARRLS